MQRKTEPALHPFEVHTAPAAPLGRVHAASAFVDGSGALVLHTGALIVLRLPAGFWYECHGGKGTLRTHG